MKKKCFINVNKNIIKDKRGFILPLVDKQSKSVSLLKSGVGAIRANHYHKSDWHYIYVLKGAFMYFYKNKNEKKTHHVEVKAGESIFTPPKLWHATYHHKLTEMLVVSKNFRDRKTYEKDTVRVNFVTKNDVKKILKKF
tara:strand:+ start:1661 stop:2077 length:417 start_codon:yes stop_codon:yes gene_type:complete